jgi:hypothetical protein
MRISEFHFNPNIKPDLIFNSFCFEPENIYERRVGNLYIVGLLKNALPKNKNLLENLAQIIKKEYYRPKSLSPEKALKEGLTQANNFLEDLGKRGDVSWLGNLSFLVMGLKGFKWNFSKVGEIKIFLFRGKRMVDVEKRAKLDGIEPYPLRVFGSLVSGKIAEGDAILILTKDVFDFFEREKIFEEIKKIGFLNEKILKEIFDKKKEEVLKMFGICLLVSFVKEILPKEKSVFLKKISPTKLKLEEIFSPFFNFFKKIKLPKPKLRKVELPKLKLPALKFNKSRTLFTQGIRLNFGKLQGILKVRDKKIVLILIWILILILGYLYSSFEEKKEIEKYQQTLISLQKKYETTKEGKDLKEIINQISPFLVKRMPEKLKNEFSLLNEKTIKKLSEIYKLEKIEPEFLFELKAKEFIPQKMISFNNFFYFFNPLSNQILKLEKEKEIIPVEAKPNFGAIFDDAILFFSKPDQLILLKDNQISKISLKLPYPNFEPSDFFIFKKNLYFLDKKEGRIIKYPWQKEFFWQEPLILIENEKIIGAKSMAIDGEIWVLRPDNKILQISGGKIKKEFDLDIFPEKKDFSKIYTLPALPYLFILEPAQKRIIVLEKSGQIKKQFQSEKFDNLLDFSISEDGRIIWVLNGLKFYKVSFTY